MNFTLELPDHLPEDLCRRIIDQFEADPNKYPSVTTNGPSHQTVQANSLNITGRPDWKELDDVLYQNLKIGIARYHEKFPALSLMSLKDYGFLIKRYEPGDFYSWHFDADALSTAARQYVAIWYLNDVEDGGETEFKYFDLLIRPTRGKLAFFPSGWTHYHQGRSPKSGPKYIITAHVSMF